MTTVVVGAGAIGLLVAGRLAQSAQRTVLLARPGVAGAIERQRLRILHDGVLQVAHDIAIVSDPAGLDQQDRCPELAILCVKGYDTAGALPALEAIQPQQILTLQNGIGNEEALAERFGADRVLSGAITTSVEVEAPGRVAITRSGGIGLAPLVEARRPVSARVAAALRAARFDVHEYADYRAMKWSKALLNMLGNATAAILDLPVAEVYADRRLIALERRAFLEALQVMKHLGIEPVNLPRYPAAQLAAAMKHMPVMLLDPLLRRLIAGGRGGKPPSLQIDLARGNRRSEGEFLYGAVARAAERSGLEAPVNRALWETLRAIADREIAWDTYRRRPERLLEAVASGQ
jgi:2-dehydropantoate 2-reductase